MLDELLQSKETGLRFPERNTAVTATTKEEEIGHLTSYAPYKTEYRLFLTVGVCFAANDVEKPYKRKIALKQLKHELYGDMISDIYQAMNSCDDPDTIQILGRMLKKIGV